VEREEHFELLRESAAKIKELNETLQSIRDQEAALQAQRVTTREELTKELAVRFNRMTAAINDKVPKVHVARALGMDRTNLYKLLDGKDDGADA
jgi:septal ring factor EnvC (AmiA/AmiB activator)